MPDPTSPAGSDIHVHDIPHSQQPLTGEDEKSCDDQACQEALATYQDEFRASVNDCAEARRLQAQGESSILAARYLFIAAAALTAAAYALIGTIIGIPAAVSMLITAAVLAVAALVALITGMVLIGVAAAKRGDANRHRGEAALAADEVQRVCPQECWGSLVTPPFCG